MSRSIEQVARLLVEIPYIQARPGVKLSQIARTLSITEAQVVADLEVARWCGLPGGYSEELINIDYDIVHGEKAVHIHNPTGLDRPMKLTIVEAASLRLALMALRDLVEKDLVGTIDSLLEKILLPAHMSVDLHLSGGDQDIRDRVQHAIHNAERLELAYAGSKSGKNSTPVIDPVGVRVLEGKSYLVAYRVDSDPGWRHYRFDRILEARPTGEATFGHGDPPSPDDWAKNLASSESATLVVTKEGRWIQEYYPTISVVDCDNDLTRITIPVMEQAWLLRLILGLGERITCVEPSIYRDAARSLAQQALDAYDDL
ncbi:MAG: WYL domain-containing protein [Propionibacteriaceae bacterium]|jgi:proteasome accessory factor C|nr:WYL domain-containing protein [Propionibacteriaceae bacterium]